MDYLSKKVLIIDLKEKDFEFKSFTELLPYIGGVGVGLKLLTMYNEEDPVIFSVGPLNGFYPYASKTSIVLNTEGVVEDLYLGGSLSTRIKFMGVDAIMIKNVSDTDVTLDMDGEKVIFRENVTDLETLGLPGRRSVLSLNGLNLDHYFKTPESFLEKKLRGKNINGIIFNGTKSYDIKNKQRYEELYKNLLNRFNELDVEKSNKPSCAGCPMGCEYSKMGEIGGNVLIHSLVACKFAEKIYSDVGIVFACLSTLGFEYKHEDIENQPYLVNEILKNL